MSVPFHKATAQKMGDGSYTVRVIHSVDGTSTDVVFPYGPHAAALADEYAFFKNEAAKIASIDEQLKTPPALTTELGPQGDQGPIGEVLTPAPVGEQGPTGEVITGTPVHMPPAQPTTSVPPVGTNTQPPVETKPEVKPEPVKKTSGGKKAEQSKVESPVSEPTETGTTEATTTTEPKEDEVEG